ncbi:MAG: right-handed parallel beta-helix repeat-containing protein [Candidatus Bathyarchaeia archaeon]
MLFKAVSATYVEGPITQDTVWTLAESPFILSKDVIVYSNAKLTIEPGVEVRFGEALSLIIEGELYADGSTKSIIFTSNKAQPDVGDWKAIKFDGTQKSTLVGCLIAYATDGVLVEGGNVEIRNCSIINCQNGITAENGRLKITETVVRLCSQNGVNATNCELTIEDSEIMENEENGVCIMGNGMANIARNTISACGNGILLTGNETSNVNIVQNKISANKQSGIKIDAENLTNIVILNNVVSSNDIGFHIYTQAGTSLMNNDISYNDLGFLYEAGNDHVANYNDIYGNGVGIDASTNASVNAEYNYWGHSSGPFHESLNPKGKGDSVKGNGTNIDFIFFLTKPFGTINERPTANLITDKVWASPDEPLMFFATNSYDGDGYIDKYFFDFGDGTDSGWTTLSISTHKYSSPGTYNAKVMVMDDYGAVSEAVETTVYIQSLQSLQVSIELGASAVKEGEEVSVVVFVSDGVSAVANVDVTLYSVKGGSFTQPNGLTNIDGYFTTTFIAPDVVDAANVRIFARASTNGVDCNDGSAYVYLQVLPILSVQIDAFPAEIKSEENSIINVHVKSNEQPLANATITLACSSGMLYPDSGLTNPDGLFSAVFTAPKTTTEVIVNIVATVKSGYISGEGTTAITVKPKILYVAISAEPEVTISEALTNITVYVRYENVPMADANVTLTVEIENFQAVNALTDSNGLAKFVLRTPPVSEPREINVVAEAAKDGYAENQSQLKLTVNPRTFSVQITAPTMYSGDSAAIVVLVNCKEDSSPVANAMVTILSDKGTFATYSGVTDPNGCCSFVFNAPEVVEQQTVALTVSVTREGYRSSQLQANIFVSPKSAEGLPLTTLLLIVVPIVIAVVLVALVKLKVIVFTFEEE